MTDFRKKVWVVEDDPDDAEECVKLLARESLEFIIINPERRTGIRDYTDLCSDPQTGAFIIDQRLSERSSAQYNGLELAKFLRILNKEVPIFLITQYSAEDLEDDGESIEFVLEKPKLGPRAAVYAARILRHVAHYDEALTGKQQRLQELINLKLSGDALSAEQEDELAGLRRDFERSADIKLADEEQREEAHLKAQQELLSQLEGIVKGLNLSEEE